MGWHQGIVVDAAGELIETQAIASEVTFKEGEFQGIRDRRPSHERLFVS
jgi:hypothetical protein